MVPDLFLGLSWSITSLTSVIAPVTGMYTSAAALTDSTTPAVAFCSNVAPTSGSSTNTTSPSASCAWCVMPTVDVDASPDAWPVLDEGCNSSGHGSQCSAGAEVKLARLGREGNLPLIRLCRCRRSTLCRFLWFSHLNHT